MPGCVRSIRKALVSESSIPGNTSQGVAGGVRAVGKGGDLGEPLASRLGILVLDQLCRVAYPLRRSGQPTSFQPLRKILGRRLRIFSASTHMFKSGHGRNGV